MSCLERKVESNVVYQCPPLTPLILFTPWSLRKICVLFYPVTWRSYFSSARRLMNSWWILQIPFYFGWTDTSFSDPDVPRRTYTVTSPWEWGPLGSRSRCGERSSEFRTTYGSASYNLVVVCRRRSCLPARGLGDPTNE